MGNIDLCEYKIECEKQIYKVGQRIIFTEGENKAWGNWYIEKVNGKKITIVQMTISYNQKTYNKAYLDKLLLNGIVKIHGTLGNPIYLSDVQKNMIRDLGVFREEMMKYIEKLLAIGITKYDWKKNIGCFISKEEFSRFIEIIYGL